MDSEQKPVNRVNTIENCTDTEDVNSLHILVDFDNKMRSLEACIRAGNSFISVTVDTGSPSSFLNKKTADKLLADPEARASMSDPDPQLQSRFVDYNKNFIKIVGVLTADISSDGWKVQGARFLVVEKKRCLLGLDLQPKIGIETRQRPFRADRKPAAELPCLSIETEVWKNYFVSKYGEIFTRQGR